MRSEHRRRNSILSWRYLQLTGEVEQAWEEGLNLRGSDKLTECWL